MESSEDDAGTATNASRRDSAREKAVGLSEDINATSCSSQGSSEVQPSCETPAMSEDNFDGDSVPSPSAQDVNTSTEAILDMIDEIVDGPGAPKRLPLALEPIDSPNDPVATTSKHPEDVQESVKNCDNFLQASPPVASVLDNINSEILLPTRINEPAEPSNHSCELSELNVTETIPGGSLPQNAETAISSQAEVSVPSNAVTEPPAPCPPPNIPTSSEEQSVQNISNISECKTQERTVKCVTSSDSRDNVTVESAESTSSDSSVSEGKPILVETLTRSPLKRRLVRPAPSDRRPDSTVSSTVDSQIVNIPTADQSSCENIAKDVTSSSDAVSTLDCNDKPEEIRNVSEINFCKAETSVSPPKKIKLIRQKNISGNSNVDCTPAQTTASAENLQCQSTSSSDSHMVPTEEPKTESSKSISIQQESDITEKLSSNCVLEENTIENSDISTLRSGEQSQPDIAPINPVETTEVHQKVTEGSQPEVLNDLSDLGNISEASQGSNNLPATSSSNTQEDSNLEKPRSPQATADIAVNIEENEISHGEHVEPKLEKEPEPVEHKTAPSQDSHTACTTSSENCESENSSKTPEDQKRVPPIKLNLSMSNLSESKLDSDTSSINKHHVNDESESAKQVPKLTIKLKQSDEPKSPVPKLTIKPIKPPSEQDVEDKDGNQQFASVTKINIKPIPKPSDNINERLTRSQKDSNEDAKLKVGEQLPSITKLNIKPIMKPPEKINDIHRKSSSSEISESEYSENDESTSTSDQASVSDQGPSDVVPKVTIKLGKPGTESEGKFYTEQNAPKLTIKGIQQHEQEEQEPKLKVVMSQSEDKQTEKIPKLTIKTVTKSEGQPLSPKLTIKPLKPPDANVKDSEILKLKISTESYSASDSKDSPHVPKITIKPVTRTDNETRTPKKSSAVCDGPEHIPIVTKLNIKPILKPMDNAESSEGFDNKVPVVSKLNIKPVIKPKDNDVDSSVDDVPKITKLNIKPLKNPEEKSSEEKDCDGLKADIDNSIPVVTKLNIKPIVKPKEDEETHKDSENQSSETGNSSDENSDHIPVVTKLNIKPIVKPDNFEDTSKVITSDVVPDTIPVVTKLNIKPLIKPGENASPSSPKKERSGHHSPSIPVVTKLNIKPVVRPEDGDLSKSKDEIDDKALKNPPLVMKINMKTVSENLNNEGIHNEHVSNNIEGLLTIAPKILNKVKESEHRLETKISKESKNNQADHLNDAVPQTEHTSSEKPKHNCVPETIKDKEEDVDKISVANKTNVNKSKSNDPIESQQSVPQGEHAPTKIAHDDSTSKNIKICEANEIHTNQDHKKANLKAADTNADCNITQIPAMTKISPVQNCTLLKKLLENTREPTDKMPEISQTVNCTQSPLSVCKNIVNSDHSVEPDNLQSEKVKTDSSTQNIEERSNASLKDINNTNKQETEKSKSMQELCEKTNETIMKPLEISISDKIINQNSGQDSPRIILKINKTDHGSSAKIITEEIKRSDTPQNLIENTQDIVNDKPSPKKHLLNSRKKQTADTSVNLSTGKRLRSSRIVENSEKSPMVRRNVGKRPSTTTETSPPQSKEPDVSILQSKRLKLGQLLSSNKSLNITPVTSPTSPTKTSIDLKQGAKTVNHPLLNNENCSKNGNSKLHNILSNLQAKQLQVLPFNNTNCSEKPTVATDIECNASMNSSDAVDLSVDNSHPEINEMIINENSDFRDSSAPEEISQDPLEVDSLKSLQDPLVNSDIPKPVEMTPQPKKRGRPRKLPVSEGAVPVPLPVPALEERPQRSLRLMRDRPAILQKPRGGRGRGRGGRRAGTASPAEPEPEPSTPAALEPAHEEPVTEPPPDIDPTSSRIKLPRMTEALDKMPSSSACSTPLSSRRRQSSGTFSSNDAPELKVAFETPSSKSEDSNKSPEASSSAKGRGSRGGRGGRGRTPRGRGRGRGGGRGAMYMKETLGIYGRVCGPATTTVQLFEEETCMMDDNATPAKPSHLLDEDSQSSVKSSTNESSKMKKSKFADLFDSNKVWTAADVKEYTWPPPERADEELKVMMIQEQVAMFLNVKSFKRRYPELKRRTIGGEERDYVLSKGLVTEALCDLGITAVDASEVLDIMLSDYPHKYEEFRSHQHQKRLMEAEEPVVEVKPEDKVRVEMKTEKPVEQKPELPKVDPEKTRQDMAAAAIASASEWNARANALRRAACADLQSLTVQRPRPVPAGPVPIHIRPPAGFYPHALLPGQYQHTYRVYTPDQLRYFPLNTVLGAAPAPAAGPACSSDSEPDWSSDCSDDSEPHAAKRKKLTKTKRSSQAEVPGTSKEESKTEEVDLCRVCKLRLEANRRYTHERFLVCANCNAKLHPSCLELNADTIRKCREYPWQCAECKTCCSCRQPADDDKMLFCDLCDRGFHIYCVGLDTVPSGRWHCVECAVCKSCGARSAWGPGGAAGAGGPGAGGPGGGGAGAGEAEWHHHTKRGPGGHKVYSHSLCTPCARAYRIGRYCPLCDRSFIGPKGTMQLVICKLCDRQLHQDCVRSSGAAPRVLDYTCAECRRGGITSRAAAVRLAPRTIATLFMAKRRFNKYAHRQYLASRQAARLAERGAAPGERADSPSDQSEPDAPDAPDAEP